MTYILITEVERQIINEFNKNGSYIAVITSSEKGDVIVDNLNDEGYEQLKEQLAGAQRITIETEEEQTLPSELPLWSIRQVLTQQYNLTDSDIDSIFLSANSLVG